MAGRARRLFSGHRGSIAVVVGSVALLGALLAGYGLLALRENWFPFHSTPPRAVTLGEARERFHQKGGTDGRAGAPFMPAAGVYEYRGEGSERLSSPPRDQPEGPSLPGTVIPGADGCWQFRLDYSSNHFRTWDFCTTTTSLVEVGNVVSQRWDFGSFAVENVTTMTCDPPAVILERQMTVGSEWRGDCRGTNTEISGTTISEGTHRFVGVEQRTVDGVAVEVLHFRDRRTVSGSQTGTERFDFWLTEQGLPVRGRQRIVVDSGSPLGRVTYHQRSAFSLVSTSPTG